MGKKHKKTLEELIDEEHPSGLCPLCDNELRFPDVSGIRLIKTHGTARLVHLTCLTDAGCELDEDIVPIRQGQYTFRE